MKSLKGYFFIIGATFFWVFQQLSREFIFNQKVQAIILNQTRITFSCLILPGILFIFKRLTASHAIITALQTNCRNFISPPFNQRIIDIDTKLWRRPGYYCNHYPPNKARKKENSKKSLIFNDRTT